MKTIRVIYFTYILAIIVSLISSYAHAQTAANGKILITGSRFTYTLVEKWIHDFKKHHHGVEIRILPRGGNLADSANLIINAHELEKEEVKPGYTVINIGRYAILPVANVHNPAYKAEYKEQGISPKEIKALYFNQFDEDGNVIEKKKKKEAYEPTLYTRDQKACAPTTFASFYGLKQEHLKGKGILGDDKHLVAKIKQDTNGITYNVLSNIYDLHSRKVHHGLAVLPIDQDGNGKLGEDEKIYDNLDHLLTNIEQGKEKEIPVGFVNISYPLQFNEANNNLKLFVQYILNEGQKHNHHYGFLDFAPESLAKQKELAEASFQATK